MFFQALAPHWLRIGSGWHFWTALDEWIKCYALEEAHRWRSGEAQVESCSVPETASSVSGLRSRGRACGLGSDEGMILTGVREWQKPALSSPLLNPQNV